MKNGQNKVQKQPGLVVLLGVFGLVVTLTGCGSTPEKPSYADKTSIPMEDVEPLAKELNEQDEYELALDMARLDIKEKRYDKAYLLLTKLKKFKPTDIRIYRLLTQYYAARDDLEMAFIASQQGLKMEGAGINDEQTYARYAMQTNRYQQADAIYQDWYDQSSTESMQVIALNNLGFSALLQQDFKQAKDYLAQALELDPLNEKARNNMKLIQSIQSKRQTKE